LSRSKNKTLKLKAATAWVQILGLERTVKSSKLVGKSSLVGSHNPVNSLSRAYRIL